MSTEGLLIKYVAAVISINANIRDELMDDRDNLTYTLGILKKAE